MLAMSGREEGGLKGEDALPCYALCAGFVSARVLDGVGWDLKTVTHQVAGRADAIEVGVVRRAISGRGRAPVPEVAAMENVTMALVMTSGAEDGVTANGLARELAAKTDAWRDIDITIDGVRAVARECHYGDAWAVTHLAPNMTVYVVGPMALRPIAIELQQVACDDLA